jgi:predicted DNA-binding transcriptional regulator AlpA
MPDAAKFLTAADLVARWGSAVNERTLANWRSKGEGPPYVKLGQRVAYPLAQVEAWEVQNTFNKRPS